MVSNWFGGIGAGQGEGPGRLTTRSEVVETVWLTARSSVGIATQKLSRRARGEDRKKPYDILLYREVINGKQVNFLYGEGNVKPFLISDKQKLELGNEIKKIF